MRLKKEKNIIRFSFFYVMLLLVFLTIPFLFGTFELIKEYRSGWNAFWYNTAASVYDLTMKQTYEPYTEKEDFYIEDILQNAFRMGRLEEQEPAIPIDLREVYRAWPEY